ncbi:hypothetical protein [Sphingosinicella sp. BN140058]|uniref:hypothetical protein n=1 Tax=Sphingosinicella sp. BN140058 TaxID=1892855 RepID=UPI00101039C7|nr:hypothetical protein [Sphingosinicella sp. BN140058]QAY80409.1 hypothetical protein ETR14_27605 [Sphingosinicella sp. BN140058]
MTWLNWTPKLGRFSAAAELAAAPEEVVDVHVSADALLVSMIEARREVDKRLEEQKEPALWSQKELWSSPEAAALLAVEGFLWKNHARGSTLDQLQKLSGSDVDLRRVAGRSAKAADIRYLAAGSDLFDEHLPKALAWSLREMKEILERAEAPLLSWCGCDLDWWDIVQKKAPLPFGLRSPSDMPASACGEWKLLCARRNDGDRFVPFDTPAGYWERSTGKAGLWLLRNGAVISTVVISDGRQRFALGFKSALF